MRTIQIGEPVDYTPRPAGQPEGDPLVTLTMREVDRFFRESTSHRPSREMMEALEAIPGTVSGIISGRAPARYHLCSLDTGVGKSVTLAETIRQVRKQHPDVGTVVCVGRYTQIEAMRSAIGLGDDEFAVLVSKNRDDLRTFALARSPTNTVTSAVPNAFPALLEAASANRSQ